MGPVTTARRRVRITPIPGGLGWEPLSKGAILTPTTAALARHIGRTLLETDAKAARIGCSPNATILAEEPR